MKNRVSQSSDRRTRHNVSKAAALILLIAVMAAAYFWFTRPPKGFLILEDPGDILNCGIEIRVQPPGKAVSTISLLSGGEKAFVAIALYFAILKVRPTPFCVMDEIEAALDEANVNRFAEYMRRMAGKTQFLVITHRRGTMEEADLLYGVTMQEKGVSTVIELDLESAQKTIEE